MKCLTGLCLISLSVLAPTTMAQEDGSVRATVMVDGLSRPAGIAVQPETGIVFVSDSGVGRICRVVDGMLEEVIHGAPVETSEGEGIDVRGPLGLAFIDKETLAVGDGSYGAGKDCVRLFKLPGDEKKILEYQSDAAAQLGPAPANRSHEAEGHFYSLAVAKHGLYVTSASGQREGSVLKAELMGTKFGEFERVVHTASNQGGGLPAGLTLSPRGEIVVALIEVADGAQNSDLAFYSAKTNGLLLRLKTGLNHISAVAYSPKTGLLYATDYANSDPGRGGLYRLDSDAAGGEQKIKATKLAKLDGATALAFDKSGTAYIAVFGVSAEASAKPTGAVVKVSGL